MAKGRARDRDAGRRSSFDEVADCSPRREQTRSAGGPGLAEGRPPDRRRAGFPPRVRFTRLEAAISLMCMLGRARARRRGRRPRPRGAARTRGSAGARARGAAGRKGARRGGARRRGGGGGGGATSPIVGRERRAVRPVLEVGDDGLDAVEIEAAGAGECLSSKQAADEEARPVVARADGNDMPRVARPGRLERDLPRKARARRPRTRARPPPTAASEGRASKVWSCGGCVILAEPLSGPEDEESTSRVFAHLVFAWRRLPRSMAEVDPAVAAAAANNGVAEPVRRATVAVFSISICPRRRVRARRRVPFRDRVVSAPRLPLSSQARHLRAAWQRTPSRCSRAAADSAGGEATRTSTSPLPGGLDRSSARARALVSQFDVRARRRRRRRRRRRLGSKVEPRQPRATLGRALARSGSGATRARRRREASRGGRARARGSGGGGRARIGGRARETPRSRRALLGWCSRQPQRSRPRLLLSLRCPETAARARARAAAVSRRRSDARFSPSSSRAASKTSAAPARWPSLRAPHRAALTLSASEPARARSEETTHKQRVSRRRSDARRFSPSSSRAAATTSATRARSCSFPELNSWPCSGAGRAERDGSLAGRRRRVLHGKLPLAHGCNVGHVAAGSRSEGPAAFYRAILHGRWRARASASGSLDGGTTARRLRPRAGALPLAHGKTTG